MRVFINNRVFNNKNNASYTALTLKKESSIFKFFRHQNCFEIDLVTNMSY